MMYIDKPSLWLIIVVTVSVFTIWDILVDVNEYYAISH